MAVWNEIEASITGDDRGWPLLMGIALLNPSYGPEAEKVVADCYRATYDVRLTSPSIGTYGWFWHTKLI